MENDLKGPRSPQWNQPQTPGTQGGIVSGIIFLFGGITLVIAILGFILGLFDRRLQVSGATLPKFDLFLFIFFLLLGSISLVLGWLVKKIEIKRRARKFTKDPNNT